MLPGAALGIDLGPYNTPNNYLDDQWPFLWDEQQGLPDDLHVPTEHAFAAPRGIAEDQTGETTTPNGAAIAPNWVLVSRHTNNRRENDTFYIDVPDGSTSVVWDRTRKEVRIAEYHNLADWALLRVVDAVDGSNPNLPYTLVANDLPPRARVGWISGGFTKHPGGYTDTSAPGLRVAMDLRKFGSTATLGGSEVARPWDAPSYDGSGVGNDSESPVYFRDGLRWGLADHHTEHSVLPGNEYPTQARQLVCLDRET